MTPWNKGEMVARQCFGCLRLYEVHPYRKETAKFCSRVCRGTWRACSTCKERKKFRVGYKSCSWACAVKNMKGKTPISNKKIAGWNKGLKGFLAGEKHYRWKGIEGGTAKNKDYRRAYSVAYTARKAGAIGSFSPDEWAALKEKFQHMCLCCKKYEPEIKLEADHIIPLSRGGSNDISNIQPLCRSCNSRKYITIINYLHQWQI